MYLWCFCVDGCLELVDLKGALSPNALGQLEWESLVEHSLN